MILYNLNTANIGAKITKYLVFANQNFR